MPYEPRAVVYTWGSKFGASDYGHGLGAIVKGGNTGHASIVLEFPSDARGKALIAEYCTPNNIPYTVEKSSSGEKYYQVYFSYWPNGLTDNLAQDQANARLGVNFSWREEFLSDKNKDIEIDRRKDKTLGPAMVIHNIPEDNPELKKLLEDYVLNYNQYRRIENEEWQNKRDIEALIKGEPTDEVIKELEKLEAAQKKLSDTKQELENKVNLTETNLKERVSLDKYLTMGSPPDNTVELPVKDSRNPNLSWKGKQGLDLEGMLEGMVKVTKNKNGYNLYRHNCSAAVATVIHGGVQSSDKESDKELRGKLKTEGFLGIATPQTVYNAALKGQTHFIYSAHKAAQASLQQSASKSPEVASKSPENILQRFVNFLQELAKRFQDKPEKPKL